jgi:hypothetical protein
VACTDYRWGPERKAEAIEVLKACHTRAQAAKRMGATLPAFDAACRKWGIRPSEYLRASAVADAEPEERKLRKQIDQLKRELAAEKDRTFAEDQVKAHLSFAAVNLPDPPKWLVETHKSTNGPGVPIVVATDWHHDEVVEPAAIGGVNEYNREIAKRRARAFVENTISILTEHMVNPKYPGLVLCLGGDMVSGDIHEELTATNEEPIMSSVLDLYGVLAWAIGEFERVFGNVFVVGVTGNHSRTTRVPRHKRRVHTNFDWLLYKFLEKRWEGSKTVRFHIPESADALFQVYGHRYLLTHGDQFKGGDGMIGVLGPVTRGDHKKRSRNAQIAQSYDTMIMGHFHQYLATGRFIMGGSIKGYDEYAHSLNLPYEPPRQALWITHPTYGITFAAPVFVEKPKKAAPGSWVSWAA